MFTHSTNRHLAARLDPRDATVLLTIYIVCGIIFEVCLIVVHLLVFAATLVAPSIELFQLMHQLTFFVHAFPLGMCLLAALNIVIITRRFNIRSM